MTIPQSSIVDVSVVINPTFPSQPGFGVGAFVTSDTGVLDTTSRYAIYSKADEVSDAWSGSSPDTVLAGNTYFAQQSRPTTFMVIFYDDAIGPETVVEALNDAVDKGASFWGLAVERPLRDITPTLTPIAQWAEARSKVFSVCSNDPDVLDPVSTIDVAYTFNAAGYQRSMVTYSSTFSEFPEIAVLGREVTVDFSGINTTQTMKFKQLGLVTAENLTTTQKSALDTKRANAYFTVGSVPMYGESFMCSTLFIDEIHGLDALVAELETEVFNFLYSRPRKVPLTDVGGAQIESVVIAVLERYVRNGFLAPGVDALGNELTKGYITTVLPKADMPVADVTARKAPPISFVGILAGAIHSVTISGTLER